MKCWSVSQPTVTPPTGCPLDALQLTPPWDAVLAVLLPGGKLRTVQRIALQELALLTSRRNLVVAAPTSGGKSLIGILLVLEALRRGKRGLWITPLRALAEEQALRWQELLTRLRAAPGTGAWPPPAAVRLTTGQHRLVRDRPDAPPPPTGEVIIATPERVDALLRSGRYDDWFGQLAAVVVDEAHLLGSTRRGPTLELLLTTLRDLAQPPRLGLLSASCGEPTRLTRWLAPCDLATTDERTPPLKLEVWELAVSERADEVILDELRRILAPPLHAALLFVYTRAATEALADRLQQAMPALGPDGVQAYHAGLSLARRRRLREAFLDGRVRCLVTTTALGQGINLPATHVIVRDLQFPGVGPREPSELLQLLGRAGREEPGGQGAVLLRSTDPWRPDELVARLQEGPPPIRSGLAGAGPIATEEPILPLATLLAARLCRYPDGVRPRELEDFVRGTLAGPAAAAQVAEALEWLEWPEQALVVPEPPDRVRLSVLGQRTARAMLPLPLAAGFGRLLRDLLTTDPMDQVLASWTALDLLLLPELLPDPGCRRRCASARLLQELDRALDQLPPTERPVLYTGWLRGGHGERGTASELRQTLQPPASAINPYRFEQAAADHGEWALQRALAVYQMVQGGQLGPSRFGRRTAQVQDPEPGQPEERVWLLHGLAELCELRTVFHHLRHDCGAGPERIRRVKSCLNRMRRQAYALIRGLGMRNEE